MKQWYKSTRFTDASRAMIARMDAIIDEYREAGYTLTVRQLYYQLVARDVIENTERSYKRTTNLVNDARLDGLLDWDAIEDRTRAFVRRQRWSTGQAILKAAVGGFHMDMWSNQDTRPFVIIEKEALVGVLENTCWANDVPLLAARGYPSVTVLREFAINDILPFSNQSIKIIHLGDHDPSGIDMTRDLRERIELFCEGNVDVEVKRIALTMDQVRQYNPPPNPAKVTDSRFEDYQSKYGDESWELDALQPAALSDMVNSEVSQVRDDDLWAEREAEVEEIRTKLQTTADKFKS